MVSNRKSIMVRHMPPNHIVFVQPPCFWQISFSAIKHFGTVAIKKALATKSCNLWMNRSANQRVFPELAKGSQLKKCATCFVVVIHIIVLVTSNVVLYWCSHYTTPCHHSESSTTALLLLRRECVLISLYITINT